MKRIEALASLVPSQTVVADIGCDHAYLLIYLLQAKKISFAYGIDNKDGPIKNALTNITRYHLQNKCQIIKADGLNFSFSPLIKTLIFAGLGGFKAITILKANEIKLSQIQYIITDLHRDQEYFTSYLEKKAFFLQQTIVIYEKHHYYHLCQYQRFN